MDESQATPAFETASPVVCPKCKVTMDRINFDDIELDRCPECQGLWFDRLELEQMRQIRGSEIIDIGADNAVLNEETHQYDCPRCRARMYPTSDPIQEHLVFEKCSRCYGVFFDAGEFTDFKNLTWWELLKSLVAERI